MDVSTHIAPPVDGHVNASAATPVKVRSHRRRFAVTLALAAASLNAAAPAPDVAAQSASTSVSIHADLPTTASYTPTSQVVINSASVTVQRSGVGAYVVFIPGTGAPVAPGVVHVTATGATAGTCKPLSWGWVYVSERVEVRCFSATGAAADSRFALSFTNRREVSQNTSLAYLVAPISSTVGSYIPAGFSSYNSTGQINKLNRSGVGVYQATLPGLALAGGTAQVTADGTGNQWCQAVGWGPTGNVLGAQLVSIRCYAPGGQPADSGYTLTFANHVNVLGDLDGGYALVDQSAISSTYAPETNYSWALDGNQMTVTKRPDIAGAYTIYVTNGLVEHAQVVPVGTTPRRCVITGWTHTQVGVRCYTAATLPLAADSEFAVSFTNKLFVIA